MYPPDNDYPDTDEMHGGSAALPSDMTFFDQSRATLQIEAHPVVEPQHQRTQNILMRILIVEDEYLLAHAWSVAIAAAGHEVIGTASSVPQALHLLQSARPDAVILDANIRGGSAEVLASQFLRDGIQYLVVSGYTADELKGALRDVTYMRKPVRNADLLRALENIAVRNSG